MRAIYQRLQVVYQPGIVMDDFGNLLYFKISTATFQAVRHFLENGFMSTKESTRNKITQRAIDTETQVRDASDDLQALKEKFLRDNGWEHTCRTPGSLWLWTKRIDVVRSELQQKYMPSPHAPKRMMENPRAGQWIETHKIYDALCSLDLAYTLQMNLSLDGQS